MNDATLTQALWEFVGSPAADFVLHREPMLLVDRLIDIGAVHAGARAKIRGEGPPLGFLLGTRHFRCSVSHFELGRRYIAECQELVRDSQGMGSFACKIQLDGENIASANLAVLEQPQI